MAADKRHRSGNTPGERVTVNAQDLQDRRLRALQLRIEGKTYDQIAKELGVGYKSAWLYVHHGLEVREKELVPKLRQIEEERLDRVIAEAFRVVNARPGTEMALKALDRVLRAVHTRASLLGLNAPVEVNLNQHTEVDVEIRALLQQQEVLNQRTRAAIIEGETAGDG